MAQDEWVVVRLKMQDSARFIAEARAAGASVQSLGRNVDQVGTSFQRSTRHGFWFNQLMFTMRRQVYGVTLGLGTLGAAAGIMGFKFDIGMDAARMAFTRFLGSPEAATREINYLFDLAAKTPFEFPQLADATRKFLAFGFSVDESNKTLAALSDGVAAFGLGADAIDRGVLALGQMRSAGRVLGQDLRQLQELGLFSPEDFQRRLNLPAGFLGNVGQLGIPSTQAIDAITAYWRDKFGGASADFAKTFMGRITTLRDYAGRAFGAMVEPLKNRLTNEIFPLLTTTLQEAGEAFQEGGMTAFFRAFDEGLDRGTDLAGIWTYLAQVGTMLFGIVRILASSFWESWNAVKGNVVVFGSLYIVVWSLYQVLRVLDQELLFGTSALELLLMVLIAERFALLAVTAATKSKIGWDIISTAWTRRKTIAETIYLYWLYRGTFFTWARTAATTAWIAVSALAVFATGALTSATWALTLALLSNPITWIVLALVGLGVALYIAYTRSESFRNSVNNLLADAQRFKSWWDDNLGWITSAPSGQELGQRAWGFLTSSHHFQFGGTMPYPGGIATVGEGGPELVHLPGGARVEPISASQLTQFQGGMSGRDIIINNKIFLDGREIAENTTRHKLDVQARS